MQVTETNVEGLKRQIKVTLGANELSDRCDRRLEELKDTVQLKGFRKGKVPKPHLKKLFGRRVMAEVLQEAVEESSRKALDERKERPASQPTIDLPEEESEIEGVMAGTTDLAYSMSYEIVPDIELVDFSTLELEKLVARHTMGQQKAQRARIILKAAEGKNNAAIGREIKQSIDMVRLWRQRWRALEPIGWDDLSVEERLDDLPRPGAPAHFSADQVCQMEQLVCEAPEKAGRPISQWTGREIANELIARGMVETISPRHAARLLKKGAGSHT